MSEKATEMFNELEALFGNADRTHSLIPYSLETDKQEFIMTNCQLEPETETD